MDGENNGKRKMDDLGVPLFLETPICTWYTGGIFTATQGWSFCWKLPEWKMNASSNPPLAGPSRKEMLHSGNLT